MSGWDLLISTSFVEVRTTVGYGRGLYVRRTRGIGVGTEVLRIEPFVHVASHGSLQGEVCEWCLQQGGGGGRGVGCTTVLKRCGQCKFVRYCGLACQRRDWPMHRSECKGICSISPNTPTDTMRLIARAMAASKERREQCLPGDAKWEVDLLCSVRENLDDKSKEKLAEQVVGVGRLVGEDFDAQLAFEVACKVVCNAFSIYEEDLSAVGIGLYIGPSLLNHSCDPNCVVVFEGRTLLLRAVKDISKGEQLLISYVDLIDTRKRRRAHLKRIYGFDCCCIRCLGEEEEEGEGEGLMDGTFARLDELQDLRMLNNWHGLIEECRRLLVPRCMNVATAKTLELLLEAYINVSNWEAAMETASSLVEPYRQYLFPYHPSRGLLMMKLGKLQRLSGTTEHLETSIRSLTQALDSLSISHGTSHSLVVQCREMLTDSQCEIACRRRVGHE